ncbi:MAG: amino acid permease [Acidobacteria bacterium]|nr:amino acid permease [Acidobacteriota bacterium]
MADTRKFGTFSGVFTPSILTILGVIMYMRLPSIIGQAGLIPTIGIIIVAHVISVTTGLSVSSIATDKRVQGGGTYYMISRSLGLPLGGTLGIALFVGLSFSVSLYLIGFAESFLGYWEIEATRNSIRLAGTIILLVVTTVTLISTSLAIKTQYFIMAAIGLSLISVFFGSHEFAPARPFLENPAGTVPLMVLFGIFFPAVTGFEAGVSMSGDLRNPKKSIPIGAITAITVGFVVYIGMAVFFSYTVDPKLLAEDPGILLKISLSPELVIAGIWGATLSSALGSILGAPRILQATSQDNIVPKFFAKSSGKLQEPRNALLLTFVIAEGGILIGELNVIARIVSIFFIMTYGFINLSAAFETWTSSDFRPEFKTPAWISFLGATACILVMIQLDLMAFLASTLILGLLFLYLKRKELTLESGDAWNGVWATIVKAGITRLGLEKIQESNWRPNIIMYSGNKQQRSHLVEFGKAISGRLGILSSFELVKTPEQGLRRIESDPLYDDADTPSAFSFRYQCSDFYKGMEEVSKLYGFYGIEPNTILMGWSSKPENRSAFSRLLASYDRSGFNIVLLSHNAERKFGKGDTIDLWWSGTGTNLAFSLVLLRHLTTSNYWNKASLRLLVINYDRSRKEQIHRSLARILEDYRMDMDIKIIHNRDTSISEFEIIRQESSQTDLTFIGIDEDQMPSLDDSFSNYSDLLSSLGTAAVLHGAPGFERVDAGVVRAPHKPKDSEATPEMPVALSEIPALQDPVLAGDIQKIQISGSRVLNRFYEKAIHPCFTDNIENIENFRRTIESVCTSLGKALEYKDAYRYEKTLLKIKNDYAFSCSRLFEQIQEKLASKHNESLASGIGWYVDWFDKYYLKLPRRLRVQYAENKFVPDKTDSVYGRLIKLWKRTAFTISGHPVSQTISYRKIARYYLYDTRQLFLVDYLKELQEYQIAHLNYLKSLFFSLLDSIVSLENKFPSAEGDILRLQEDLASRIDDCAKELNQSAESFRDRLQIEFREDIIAMAGSLQKTPYRRFRPPRPRSKKFYSTLAIENRKFTDRWCVFMERVTNKIRLDIQIAAIRCRTEDKAEDLLRRILQQVDLKITHAVRNLLTNLDSMLKGETAATDNLRCEIDTTVDIEEGIEELRDYVLELARSLPETQLVGDDKEETEIPAIRLVDRILESRMISPLQEFLISGNELLGNLGFRIKDLVNLTRFSFQNMDVGAPDGRKTVEGILRDNIQSLRMEEEAVDNFKSSLREEMRQLLSDAFEPLAPEKIEKSSGEMAEILREYAGQKVLTTFGNLWNTGIRSLERYVIRILYSKSEGLLFARKLKNRGKANSGNASVLDLVRSITPESKVMQALPRFYTNLFSSRSSIGTEFFIERDEDETRMKQAVDHYKNGYKGGILVLGDRNAGKTTFCKYITGKLFPKNNVIHIFAPNEGSMHVEDLARIVEQAAGYHGTLREIASALPHETVLVIHDLELWFEQHRDGTQVIRTIGEMMDDFSDRILFIVNTNPHSFALINSLEPIHQKFISTVRLSPFSTEELKDMILRRHRSSGLQFRWNGRDEKSLSELRTASLFDSHFTHSEGNPGMALNAWLHNIQRLSGNTVEISTPETPNLTTLRQLDDDRLVLLSAFALHKRLTIEQLGRITGLEEPVLESMIRTLQRCGLIKERGRGVLVINMFLEPFIIKVLSEKQIL